MISYIDMHCDTLLNGVFSPTKDIYDLPQGMVDIRRLHQAGVMCQFMAVFFPPRFADDEHGRQLPADDWEFFLQAREVFERALREHGDMVARAVTAEDILANAACGRTSLMLTVEDGRAVEGKMERLQAFYDAGVRAMSLTWNYANCFGFPNSSDSDIRNRGLTDFGKEAVGEMNRLGMLVDVSHLSDGGFYDVAAVSRKPFVATHSNCRALSPHPRNLTDDMIRVLAEKGGVAGLNFAAGFLNEDMSWERSRVTCMVRHVKHMIAVGGEDCVAIGTDFDGVGGQMEIGEPAQMELLWEALTRAGISPRIQDKIASGNVMRVLASIRK